MLYKTIRNLTLVLILAVIGVACGDSSTGTNNNSKQATVEGRTDNTSSSSQKLKAKGLDGAVVTAAKIDAEGNLQTIDGAETTTNAQGEFSLDIDGEAVVDASNRIVIVAEKNGETAKTFVGSEVKGGSTVEAQPITFESSSEASVYQQVIANGDEDVVSKADIELAVNAKVAADIESNTSDAADVAAALAAKADAKAEFYSEQSVEVTDQQKDEIAQAKADALVKLEEDLNATTDTAEANSDFDAFVKSMATVETDAGVNAAAVAKSSESSNRMLLQGSANLSSDAQAEIRQHAAYTMSFALDAAVQAQLNAASAEQATVDAAADSAVSLQANIKAMTDASEANIDSAFADFNTQIEALVNSDTKLEGSFFVSANSTINGQGGAKSTLKSALEASLDLNLLMSSYTNFYTSVQSTVDSTFTGASDSEVEAYTQLLILINIAS